MAKKYPTQMNKQELKDYARQHNINVPHGVTRKDILDLIRKYKLDPNNQPPTHRCKICSLGQMDNDNHVCKGCGGSLEVLQAGMNYITGPMNEPEPEVEKTEELRPVTQDDMVAYKCLRPYIAMRGYLRSGLTPKQVQEAKKLCEERGFILPQEYKEWSERIWRK